MLAKCVSPSPLGGRFRMCSIEPIGGAAIYERSLFGVHGCLGRSCVRQSVNRSVSPAPHGPPPSYLHTIPKTHLCQKWRFPVLDSPCASPLRPRTLPSASASLLTTTISSWPGSRNSPVCVVYMGRWGVGVVWVTWV